MILSHRGYWLNEEEKNTKTAFERSFSMGFGTETDIRDFNGELVIAHDVPVRKGMTLDEFFQIFIAYDKSLPLALNIKADGLQDRFLNCIRNYNIENYFVFDMSVPDALCFLKKNIKVYTRQSEFEKTPSFYDHSEGVWLDEFFDHWITKEIIQGHIENKKKVCIVSPELHKRDYIYEWKTYKENFDIIFSKDVSLCTDKPIKAKNFFK